jgi:hypothetical protein
VPHHAPALEPNGSSSGSYSPASQGGLQSLNTHGYKHFVNSFFLAFQYLEVIE